MRVPLPSLAALALLGVWLPAALAAEPAPDPDPGPRAWRHLRATPRLLDDPAGLRSALEELGVGLELFFNHTAGALARGGRGDGDDLRQSGSADLFALSDLGELGLLPGALFLLHAKSSYNRNVNPSLSALSDPVDDADFDEPIWIAQLWLQQDLLGRLLSVRAGYLDQQVLFDRNAYANSEDRQFLATFLDNDPIVPLRTGLGAAVIVRPLPALELGLGVGDADNVPRQAGFDSAFDGFGSLVGYFEATARVRLPGPKSELPGSYRLGAFRDGSRKVAFGTTARDRGHYGGYASFDQLVYRERPGSEQGLGLFFRAGVADDDVNAIAGFLSGGLQYSGPLPGRDDDVIGLGTYHTLPSERLRERVNRDYRGETGLELYYRIQLAPWLHLTPDLQWMDDPGGISSARDAIVVGLRTRVAF